MRRGARKTPEVQDMITWQTLTSQLNTIFVVFELAIYGI
jgi:hypothetical protein